MYNTFRFFPLLRIHTFVLFCARGVAVAVAVLSLYNFIFISLITFSLSLSPALFRVCVCVYMNFGVCLCAYFVFFKFNICCLCCVSSTVFDPCKQRWFVGFYVSTVWPNEIDSERKTEKASGWKRGKWRKERASVCVCTEHTLVCVSCSELKLQMLISILVCTHSHSTCITYIRILFFTFIPCSLSLPLYPFHSIAQAENKPSIFACINAPKSVCKLNVDNDDEKRDTAKLHPTFLFAFKLSLFSYLTHSFTLAIFISEIDQIQAKVRKNTHTIATTTTEMRANRLREWFARRNDAHQRFTNAISQSVYETKSWCDNWHTKKCMLMVDPNTNQS